MATTITDREAGSLIMPTCIQWCISTYSNPYSKHYYYRNHRVGLNHHQPTNYISKKLPISYIKWFWPNIFSQCVEGGKSYSKDCAPARGACTFDCNYVEPKLFSWAKPAWFGFSSSNFSVHDHMLITVGDALRTIIVCKAVGLHVLFTLPIRTLLVKGP